MTLRCGKYSRTGLDSVLMQKEKKKKLKKPKIAFNKSGSVSNLNVFIKITPKSEIE